MEKEESSQKSSGKTTVLTVLILVALVLTVYNQVLISGMGGGISTTGFATASSSKAAGEVTVDSAIEAVIPTGTPDVYGSELGVSFDDPGDCRTTGSCFKLANLDPGMGKNPIQLNDQEMQRYINVGTKISCEFCCSAPYIVTSTGKAACGCAHSQAMRGLAAYLIQNHPDEFTDDQVLEELTKWKALFFPQQMVQRYIEQNGAGDITALNQLPTQVGGC